MYRSLVLGVSLFLSCSAALAQGFISRSLHQPVPGGVAVVALGVADRAPVVMANGNRAMVLQDSDGQWIAVVGVDLKASAGRHTITVQEEGKSGRTQDYVVGSKAYQEQRITLKNKSHVNPDAAQLKRYEREARAQSAAYASFRDVAISNVMLDRPVSGRLSSPFGLRRFFNGEERNAHSGLDFAVPQGTAIKAPADGVVTIVGDYFFNGKTVFVDHGQGFITMYCHLSEFNVLAGQTVTRGETIGKVGATGRATGPHLHWNVSLNNTRVDPAIFIGAFKP